MIVDRTIEALRECFFPGWAIEREARKSDGEGMAYYRIECRTLTGYRLACLAKPDSIQAEILYVPGLRGG